MPYGYLTPTTQLTPDEVVWVDPKRAVPFPSWMADGLGKYFLLAMSTILQLDLIRYSSSITTPTSTTPVKNQYSVTEAVHQSIWLAIVWWQGQAFDAQLSYRLQYAVESLSQDIQACDAMSLDKDYDATPVAQLMLECIPRDTDENIATALQQPQSNADAPPPSTQYTGAPPMDNLHYFIQQLMDMRDWNLVQVARRTLNMSPLRDTSFWFTVPMCNFNAFKRSSTHLMLLPSLCSTMRRINMLRTVFYGYRRILDVVDRWEFSITQYMHVMDSQFNQCVADTTPACGNHTELDKAASKFVSAQLRRIMEETSESYLPRDVRGLFLSEPIKLLEQCALVAYCCNAESFYAARKTLSESDSCMLLACLMRAAAIHWHEAYEDLSLQQRTTFARYAPPSTMPSNSRNSWLNINLLLPQVRNPITREATLCDSDLRPPYITAERWNRCMEERHAGSPVAVVGTRLFTMPTDLYHMLATVTYHLTYTKSSSGTARQPSTQKNISMFITSHNRPDILLHYAGVGKDKGLNAHWTMINCNKLNHPPSVLEITSPPDGIVVDVTKANFTARKDEHTYSTPYHPHLVEAHEVAPRLLQVIPHSYMFRVMEVHAATLDITAYERAAHANLMQHVVRTMPRGGDDKEESHAAQ